MKKTLIISGMHCASCAASITKALEGTEGVREANVNFASSKAFVDYDESKTDENRLIDAVRKAGFLAATEKSSSIAQAQRKKEIDAYRRIFIFSLFFAVPAFIIGMVLMWLGIKLPYAHYVMWALATPVQFISGWRFYVGAFAALKRKTANMDTLVVLGTTAAYAFSVYSVIFMEGGEHYFEVSAILITLVILGKWLEAQATGKAGDAIQRLMVLKPSTANIKKGGKFVEVQIDDIKVGDVILVKPGGKVPVDGIVIEGESSVDESMITGESMPVDKRKGSKLFSATINKSGSLVFRATRVGTDTTLSRIISLIEEAQSKKAPIQRFADVVSSYFVQAVLLIALFTSLAWIILGKGIEFSLLSAVSVLVIACPCALGLATPTAIMVGTGLGARKGILIKGGEALETAYKANYVVFDKTGTVTKGIPEVTDVVGNDPRKIIKLAASLESHSEHPIALAVIRKAGRNILKSNKFKAFAGMGITAQIGRKKFLLGNRKLMTKHNVPVAEYSAKIDSLEDQGKTVVILAEKKVLGLIAVADTIKDGSSEAVSTLNRMGIEVFMVTGDNKKTANTIAKKAGIRNVVAEVMPEDKVALVRKLKKKGTVVMVGDGINDAPALAAADIGIAMGGGTDVAMETGDVVLMRDDIRDVPRAINLSRITISKVRQNMFWALFYNVMGIPIAAGVLYPFTGWLLSPIIAGGAMALSSLSVVTNSLLLRYQNI